MLSLGGEAAHVYFISMTRDERFTCVHTSQGNIFLKLEPSYSLCFAVATWWSQCCMSLLFLTYDGESWFAGVLLCSCYSQFLRGWRMAWASALMGVNWTAGFQSGFWMWYFAGLGFRAGDTQTACLHTCIWKGHVKLWSQQGLWTRRPWSLMSAKRWGASDWEQTKFFYKASPAVHYSYYTV